MTCFMLIVLLKIDSLHLSSSLMYQMDSWARSGQFSPSKIGIIIPARPETALLSITNIDMDVQSG